MSNSKIGLALFAVYLLLYSIFVGVNAFAPKSMEAAPIADVNIAILSGFGLIIAAFVMSLVYGVLCKSEPAVESKEDVK